MTKRKPKFKLRPLLHKYILDPLRTSLECFGRCVMMGTIIIVTVVCLFSLIGLGGIVAYQTAKHLNGPLDVTASKLIADLNP